MTDQRRGKRLAIIGAVLQAMLGLALLLVWRGTRSDAALASMWFLMAGVPLWIMAAVLFYCRQLASREAQEIEEIAAHGGDQGALFERSASLEQRPAARRVALAERWAAPAFTLLWTALQVFLAVMVGRALIASTMREVFNPGPGAVFLLVLAMAAFLFSYYCLGMAREEQWRLHRATGSYLLVCSLLIGASAIGMLLAYWRQYLRPDDIVAYAVPVLQLLLSLELVLNFVLDLYRPRLPGQEHRFSFDSRLFNVLAEPGKVGHSIAETINYQFGFEVSKTWFYQLVSRATVWLLLASAAILLLLSCVLVVRDGETYVVRRWGRFEPGEANVGPGLHFKLPWPVETAERFETGAIHEVLLGAGRERSRDEIMMMDYTPTQEGKLLEVLNWSKEHGEHEELDFLIAFPPRKREDPPVHIIRLVVQLQYAVRDVYKYGYQFVDPRSMVECLAYRELTQYFATATLDSPVAQGAKDRPQAIMTFGRGAAAEELKKRVQAMTDRFGMGIEITNVSFVGVHPPPSAAGEFENVLKAQRGMELKRFQAEGDAAQVLTRQAGSPAAALQLALAIERLDELKDLHSLRSDAAAFASQRQRYLRDANDRIGALRAEVEQERLEGRLRSESPDANGQPGQRPLTDRQLLLASYEEHRSALEALTSPADLTVQLADASASADRLFDQASGDSASVVSKAKGERWKREMNGRGEWEGFQAALPAYRANPVMYEWDHWLAVWEDVLPGLYKYVLAVDRKNVEVRMDWTRPPASLEDVSFQKP